MEGRTRGSEKRQASTDIEELEDLTDERNGRKRMHVA
jgi:hypothetical protein